METHANAAASATGGQDQSKTVDKIAEKRAKLEAKLASLDVKARRANNPAWAHYKAAARAMEKVISAMSEAGRSDDASLVRDLFNEIEPVVDGGSQTAAEKEAE